MVREWERALKCRLERLRRLEAVLENPDVKGIAETVMLDEMGLLNLIAKRPACVV